MADQPMANPPIKDSSTNATSRGETASRFMLALKETLRIWNSDAPVKQLAWKQLATHCASQCGELLLDGAIWIVGILMLALAHAALGFLHLPARQAEMLEKVQINTVYTTILVASAGTVSRLLINALERLGHWERGE